MSAVLGLALVGWAISVNATFRELLSQTPNESRLRIAVAAMIIGSLVVGFAAMAAGEA